MLFCPLTGKCCQAWDLLFAWPPRSLKSSLEAVLHTETDRGRCSTRIFPDQLPPLRRYIEQASEPGPALDLLWAISQWGNQRQRDGRSSGAVALWRRGTWAPSTVLSNLFSFIPHTHKILWGHWGKQTRALKAEGNRAGGSRLPWPQPTGHTRSGHLRLGSSALQNSQGSFYCHYSEFLYFKQQHSK